MREFYPLIFSAIAIGLFGAVEIALLFLLNRPWWRRRWIRHASWLLPLFGITMVLLWGIGIVNSQDWLVGVAAVATALTFVLEIALMLSLPLSGGVHLIGWLLGYCRKVHRKPPDPVIDRRRRVVLKSVAAALPVMTLGMGAAGIGRALSCVEMPVIPIGFSHLPRGLSGLKILQLSDLHLGNFIRMDHLGGIVAGAEQHAPDLVLITGDFVDDLRLLGEALAMVSGLNPRLGVYACLGNHEYYRGLTTVRRIFDRSPVPLLVDNSLRIDHHGASLRLGGVDDPRYMGASTEAFYKQAIDATLSGAGTDEFRVLMCHRPSGFDSAAAVDVELTLAGHTHGGQMGFAGRSALEPFYPELYLWGHYRRGSSQLYTTAGAGHWFPFRLGCPTEVPVIVLSEG